MVDKPVSIRVENTEQTKRYINGKNREAKGLLPECVRNATLYLHGKIKESVSRGVNAKVAVDTGTFVNTIQFEPLGDNDAVIFSPLYYGKFIEYGTSRMGARPHFRNTAYVERNNVVKRFKNNFRL